MIAISVWSIVAIVAVVSRVIIRISISIMRVPGFWISFGFGLSLDNMKCSSAVGVVIVWFYVTIGNCGIVVNIGMSVGKWMSVNQRFLLFNFNLHLFNWFGFFYNWFDGGKSIMSIVVRIVPSIGVRIVPSIVVWLISTSVVVEVWISFGFRLYCC